MGRQQRVGECVALEATSQAHGPCDYVPISEALRLLGVRPQTLYAYASRGWVRSIRQHGRKEHLYALEDLKKLKARSSARSGHGAVAAGAMNWGHPIIETTITEITPEGPRYRNHLATDLARSHVSFEAVAELLWTGRRDETVQWKLEPIPTGAVRLVDSVPAHLKDRLLDFFSLMVLTFGIYGSTGSNESDESALQSSTRQMIQTLSACCGFASSQRRFVPLLEGERLVVGLVRALGAEPTDENWEALEAILILLADHELSPGAFAARLAASSGAALHSCIVAGLCATAGVQTGHLYDRVEDMLSSASTSEELFSLAQEMRRQNRTPPGFEHPLYPRGDPRGRYLLNLAKRRPGRSKHVDGILGYIDEVGSKFGLQPRHELGVITLALAMDLPRYSAGALFALARISGLAAHVQEQRLAASLLRPRARFTRP